MRKLGVDGREERQQHEDRCIVVKRISIEGRKFPAFTFVVFFLKV